MTLSVNKEINKCHGAKVFKHVKILQKWEGFWNFEILMISLKPGSHLCDKRNTSDISTGINTRKKEHFPFFLCLCLCLCRLCYAYRTSVNQALGSHMQSQYIIISESNKEDLGCLFFKIFASDKVSSFVSHHNFTTAHFLHLSFIFQYSILFFCELRKYLMTCWQIYAHWESLREFDCNSMVGKTCCCCFENLRWLWTPCTECFKTLPKVASYPAYQIWILRKNFTVPFFKYKRLKLKLRVFLTGYSVAMVTYSVTKMIPTCSPVIEQ